MRKIFDDNLQLVQAMGSKHGYDPMPPDNYLYFADSKDAVQRVLAYVRSKTIRKGFRSPFAVTKAGGRPITKADLARDKFDGNKGNAWRAWDLTAATGLVFENEDGFLCLAGNVKKPATISVTDRRTKGVLKLSLETMISPDLIEKINALPAEKQEPCKAAFSVCEEWRSRIAADAATLVQFGPDRVHDNIRRAFGLPVKRLTKKHRPDLHKNGSKYLQLELLLVPAELKEFADFPALSKVSRDNGSAKVSGDNKKPVSGDNSESVERQPAEVRSDAYSQAFESSDPGVPLKTQRKGGKEGTPLSVGRSSSSVEQTDRPTRNPELQDGPFKAKIREWLESHVKLPVSLEDPELNQIAATIQTAAHFEQFKQGANRQKDPRGWRVFITIAHNCQKHQEKYEQSAAAGVDQTQDPLLKRLREEIERQKSWPTS